MIKKILGLCGLIFIASGCSDISEDDRLIEMDSVERVRTIVIEDFTGQNCVNCPDAHKVLEALVEQYGDDHIIPVSIHAGSFAISATRTNYEIGYIGLMQPEGQTMNDAYSINAWPAGVVNGRGGATNPDAWPQAARVELEREPEASLEVVPVLSEDGKTIKIETVIHSFGNLDVKLRLWVVENGIIARQKDNTGSTISDYRHDNVFRATVTPLDGDAVSLTQGEKVTVSHTIAVRDTDKERWNLDNISVVGILVGSDGYVNANRSALSSEK